MAKETKCNCPDRYIVGVEYGPFEPERYDGISEWRCTKCLRRWGCWSNRELFDGDLEPRYGFILTNKNKG
jgi:hypothetical protein